MTDLSGALFAFSLFHAKIISRTRKLLGFVSLSIALFALSRSWDRVGCFLYGKNDNRSVDCGRVWGMSISFLAGFLGYFEKEAANWGQLNQLGRKKVKSLTLGFSTLMLFFPALFSFVIGNNDNVSVGDGVWRVGWPLVNTVLFGVLLSNCEEKVGVNGGGNDFEKEFLVTFLCTSVLELFYFTKLSLPGFLFNGLLLWVAHRELGGGSNSDNLEIGSNGSYESLYSMVMKPVRHIMSEQKSRKIAMFLLINLGYMVVEFVAGFMSNSLGLISDACHMLFDCAALGIGLYASYISRLPSDHRYNYGRGRMEVLSGYVNAVFLVLVGALIVLESIERILDPQEISTNSLLVVSIGGLLVNVIGLIFFHEEHHHAHGGGACSHSHHNDHKHHVSDETNHEHGLDDEHHSHECSNGHSHASHDDHLHPLSIGHSNDKQDDCGNHDHDNHKHDELDNHKHDGINNRMDNDYNHHAHCHDDNIGGSHKIIKNSNDSDHSHIYSSNCKVMENRRHIDHNMEGIFLHVLADTLGSVGVVISTLLIKYKGWLIADPACSIFISVMIIASVIPLLRNSAEILLQRIPRAHESELKVAVEELMKVNGVCDIQKLHIWNFTNTDIVGTVHLHVAADTDKSSVKKRVSKLFHDAGIKDLTIQIESVDV